MYDICIYLAVPKDEQSILLTMTRKKSLAEKKSAALHGCINLNRVCCTEKHAYDVFGWDSATFFHGKTSTKCQHFTGLVRFTVCSVGSKSNMKPTKCQQTPNKCQHFVNIGGWLPEKVFASNACQKQLKKQNTASYQISLDFSTRTEKNMRWYSQVYIYMPFANSLYLESCTLTVQIPLCYILHA